MARVKKDCRNDEFEARTEMMTYPLRKEFQDLIARQKDEGTCFKGHSYMTAKDLNPNPVKSAQMRKQNFW